MKFHCKKLIFNEENIKKDFIGKLSSLNKPFQVRDKLNGRNFLVVNNRFKENLFSGFFYQTNKNLPQFSIESQFSLKNLSNIFKNNEGLLDKKNTFIFYSFLIIKDEVYIFYEVPGIGSLTYISLFYYLNSNKDFPKLDTDFKLEREFDKKFIEKLRGKKNKIFDRIEFKLGIFDRERLKKYNSFLKRIMKLFDTSNTSQGRLEFCTKDNLELILKRYIIDDSEDPLSEIDLTLFKVLKVREKGKDKPENLLNQLLTFEIEKDKIKIINEEKYKELYEEMNKRVIENGKHF